MRGTRMPGTAASNRGLQLWVNLRADEKQMAPQYEGIAGADMPVHERDGLRIHTIAGAGSPVALRTEVDYLDVELLADASFALKVAADHAGLLYVLDGSVQLGDGFVPARQAVILSPGAVSLRGAAGARFAWLTGRPHRQPIRHRGPFVD
ncbi:MAG: pirin-like C-terminal cupin domain-containing protein [Nannocystaceae bacterium]